MISISRIALGCCASLVGCGLVLAAGGCSTTQARPNWVRNIIFWEEREVDPRYQGPMPSERIEQLRAQAKTLSSAPPDVQQSTAAELAAAFRNEADPLIRMELVRTIARCGSPQSAETLDAALRDAERDVRVIACDAWATHGGPQALTKLAEVLRQERDPDVKLSAMRALSKIGGADAIAAVSPALEDKDPAMQYRAVQALRTMTGKDFGDDVNAWREFVQGRTPPEISVAERMKRSVF